jgi:hypothetical protein
MTVKKCSRPDTTVAAVKIVSYVEGRNAFEGRTARLPLKKAQPHQAFRRGDNRFLIRAGSQPSRRLAFSFEPFFSFAEHRQN